MAAGHSPVVRRALPEEATAVLALMDSLADYEKLARPDGAARERLTQDLFGPQRRADTLLVLLDEYPVGYAVLVEMYSTFLALPTLYLEDLFVMPEYRRRKAGYALFQECVEEARRRGCGRMEWSVLSWNQLAIDFYRRAGGHELQEWRNYRIDLI